MLWSICLGISIGIPVLVPLIAAVWKSHGSGKIKRLSLFHVGFFSVGFSAVVMFFPLMYVPEAGGVLHLVKSVFLSFFSAMKIFGLGLEYALIGESSAQCPEAIVGWYRLWASVLLVLAPLFTFGVVLSIFRNVTARIRYALAYHKEAYVFSELNVRSLALAADLKNKHPKAVIVFADVFGRHQEATYELMGEAKLLGAVFFKKDIAAIGQMGHTQRKPLMFFAIGADENENLDQALHLIASCKDRENTHLYVFSMQAESEIVLSALDKGKIKVRRINDVLSLVNRVLYEEGHTLFENALPTEEGVKEINAVIVGMGQHGSEMLKALAWYGQMDGYRIGIHAFDRDPLAEQKLTAAAPELLSPEYNGVFVEDQPQYHITVHSECNVETAAFAEQIRRIENATYVLISLGNDNLNIQTAVYLRMLFERIGIHPVIQAIVYDKDRQQAMEGMVNCGKEKQAYDIQFIGDIESCYTESIIINSELERAGLAVHLAYAESAEQKLAEAAKFWNYEYFYRSSIASAIHNKMRIYFGVPGAGKPEKDMTPEEKAVIEPLEHRRWVVYLLANGFAYGKKRNDLAKLHNLLVPFEELDDDQKRKDSRVASGGPQ